MVYWPRPSRTANTPTSTPAGKLILGWGEPLIEYLGRFHDSTTQMEFQSGYRTERARTMIVDVPRDRLIMQLGNGVASYKLSTLPQRLRANTPLRPAPGQKRGAEPELSLQPAQPWPFYAEWAWSDVPDLDKTDGQDKLYAGIAIDDRGFVAVANTQFGLALLDHDGRPLTRIAPDMEGGTSWAPYGVIAFRDGFRDYLMVGHEIGQVSRIYDTTTPSVPVRKSDVSIGLGGMSAYRHAKAGGWIAVLANSGRLHITTANGLLLGGVTTRDFDPPKNTSLSGLATDGSAFYTLAVAFNSSTTLIRLAPTSFAWDAVPLPFVYQTAPSVRYGSGYIVIFGQESQRGASVRLLRADTLAEVPFANDFPRKFYAGGPISIDALSLGDVAIHGDNMYVGAVGLGDGFRVRLAGSGVAQPPVEPPAQPPVVVPPVAPPVVPPVVPPATQPVIVASGNLVVGGVVRLTAQGAPIASSGMTWRYGDGQQAGGAAAIASNPITHVYDRAGVYKVECWVGIKRLVPVEITIAGQGGASATQPSSGKQRAVRTS